MRVSMEQFVNKIQNSVVYATTIALLAVASLGMLLYEFSPWASANIVILTQRLDIVIAWIFLTDFFAGLLFNSTMSKKQYWRENYLNLISSIPITEDAVRILRILRIFRAFRVIRAATNFWFAKERLKHNQEHLHT